METIQSSDMTLVVQNDDLILTPRPSDLKIKRSVTWAEGTAEAPSARLAVSIPRHKTNKVRLIFSI